MRFWRLAWLIRRHRYKYDDEALSELMQREIGADVTLSSEKVLMNAASAELTRKGLDRLGLKDIAPEDVNQLDSVAGIKDLQRVGRAVADQQVKAGHFSSFV